MLCGGSDDTSPSNSHVFSIPVLFAGQQRPSPCKSGPHSCLASMCSHYKCYPKAIPADLSAFTCRPVVSLRPTSKGGIPEIAGELFHARKTWSVFKHLVQMRAVFYGPGLGNYRAYG